MKCPVCGKYEFEIMSTAIPATLDGRDGSARIDACGVSRLRGR